MSCILIYNDFFLRLNKCINERNIEKCSALGFYRVNLIVGELHAEQGKTTGEVCE